MALVGGCYSPGELLERVKTSANMTAWLLYLEMRTEEENAKMRAMMGEQ